MNIDNLTDEQIRILEAQNKMLGKFKPMAGHPDRVNYDNMTDDQIRTLEAQAKRYEPGPSGIHPDRVNIDSMTDDQIRTLEAQAKMYNPGPSGIHPDRIGIENMDSDSLRVLEAQVRERKEADIPFNQYLDGLISNPVVEDEQQFEDAVFRSMQSNSVMEKFINNLINKISQKVFDFKSIDSNDKDSVEKAKAEIEQLVALYEKFLMSLKTNGWSFNEYSLSVESMMLPEQVQMNLWRLQKNYGIEFRMPIPVKLDDDYGNAFERDCKMVPGFTHLYDELKGRKPNWIQVMYYREGELTPRQKFEQRRAEKLKKFEEARQAEVKASLEKAMVSQGMVR